MIVALPGLFSYLCFVIVAFLFSYFFVATFFGKSCHLCLPYILFVALLYLSVFPFGVGGLRGSDCINFRVLLFIFDILPKLLGILLEAVTDILLHTFVIAFNW